MGSVIYNHPIGKDYKWYISGIFPANWGIILYGTYHLIGGTRKLHWSYLPIYKGSITPICIWLGRGMLSSYTEKIPSNDFNLLWFYACGVQGEGVTGESLGKIRGITTPPPLRILCTQFSSGVSDAWHWVFTSTDRFSVWSGLKDLNNWHWGAFCLFLNVKRRRYGALVLLVQWKQCKSCLFSLFELFAVALAFLVWEWYVNLLKSWDR